MAGAGPRVSVLPGGDTACVAVLTSCLAVVVTEEAASFAVSTACDAVCVALLTSRLAVVVTEEAASFAVSTACGAACVAVASACPAVFVTAEATSFAEPAPVLTAAGADEAADVTVEPADWAAVVATFVAGAGTAGAETCPAEGVATAGVASVAAVWATAVTDATVKPPLVLDAGAALLPPADGGALDWSSALVTVPAPTAGSDAVV